MKWKKSSLRTSTKRLHGSAKISLAAEISARNERSFFWAKSTNRPSWRWAHLSAANMEYENVVKNDHIFTESRTCQRIASEHGVGEKTVRRAEKYSQGIDAAEEAVPGAQEEILTGRIKATDAQIAALPAIPKEERPAILDELRKEKGKRNENLLSRLKPERPPPKSAPPKPPEPPQNEEPAAPEPVTPSPPEEEIEPASNGPPSFLQKIQGHKRHLSEEDMARLKVSVDSRYRDRIAKSGSIMLCELQGAAEDFMFRWGIIFQNYPDVLTNETSREEVSALIDRMTTYLNTVKEM
ncbi:hypothetical protein [Faecalibacterium duncaniae]|nr:hypothetical protein [Faecalibacterium duncaniae]MDV5057466.1 hypothetical protein [Faecalibacterium duncaniae]QIA42624.1 hypothetical protein GXM22_05785 [Faecalibacterium duncaniae]